VYLPHGGLRSFLKDTIADSKGINLRKVETPLPLRMGCVSKDEKPGTYDCTWPVDTERMQLLMLYS